MSEYPINTRKWLQRAIDDPAVLGTRYYCDESVQLMRILETALDKNAVIPDSETLASLVGAIQHFVSNTKLGAVANVMEIWLSSLQRSSQDIPSDTDVQIQTFLMKSRPH